MADLQQQETCRDIAGILARGYDMHVHDHGPSGSAALRTPDGSRYEVIDGSITTKKSLGAVSFVDRDGERFAINVVPLGPQPGGTSG